MDNNFVRISSGHSIPEIMNNPFHYFPTPLLTSIQKEVAASIMEMEEWRDDVQAGKMFGFLIVENADGEYGYIKAYSGQILGRENWDGWVPAVFDYLRPDGYFVTHEEEISAINREIAELECSPRLAMACSRMAGKEAECSARIEEYRRFCAEQKALRAERRKSGEGTEALIAESQFQKAELRRIKKASEEELMPLRMAVDGIKENIVSLKRKRKHMSDSLQSWLFDHFVILNAQGQRSTLTELFAGTPQRTPPSGAGECCAPKLLQYAYNNRYKPRAIGEFWIGSSPKGEVRRHLDFYPACQGKCKPILDFMLQGLTIDLNPYDPSHSSDSPSMSGSLSIVYRDSDIIVVDKPSGMLSVPGRINAISAQELLQEMVGSDNEVLSVHRLDMHTSGLLLFALNPVVRSALQGQFAKRETKKEYVALIERNNKEKQDELFVGKRGTISLPLASDYLNRPRQIVDYVNGKEAVTEYEVMEITESSVRLLLHPHHGRTHQLRVHCAHQDGLGMPIIGDMLYGHPAARLMLHARSLTISNPLNGKRYSFTAPSPF